MKVKNIDGGDLEFTPGLEKNLYDNIKKNKKDKELEALYNKQGNLEDFDIPELASL
jgi:hypothetical protein